jgi:hypothetical protein
MKRDLQGDRGTQTVVLTLFAVVAAACAEVPAGLSEIGEPLPGKTNPVATGGTGSTTGATGTSNGGAALAGFALSSIGSPGLCLQPSVWPVVGSTPLVAMPCDQSAAQRWKWSATGFQLVDGSGCLSSQAAAPNAPAVVTAACTDLSKLFMWDGLIYNDTEGFPDLSPTVTPIVAGTTFRFNSASPSPSRWFNLIHEAVAAQGGQPADPAGFTVIPSNNLTACLTNTTTGLRVLPCVPRQENQRWNFELSKLRQGTTCFIPDPDMGFLQRPCAGLTFENFSWLLTRDGDILGDESFSALFNNDGQLQRVPDTTPNRFWILGAQL